MQEYSIGLGRHDVKGRYKHFSFNVMIFFKSILGFYFFGMYEHSNIKVYIDYYKATPDFILGHISFNKI